MGGFELAFVNAARPDAVAALDLVGERELLAGELARDRLDADELGAEPAAPLFLQPVELGPEPGCLLCERRRFGERLRADPLLDRRIAVVGVDEPVDVPPEPEAELDVALGDAHRSKSAAWPWPTPTQRVARP